MGTKDKYVKRRRGSVEPAQPLAIYGTLFPLQHPKSDWYNTPNIVYIENLKNAMTPSVLEEIWWPRQGWSLVLHITQ